MGAVSDPSLVVCVVYVCSLSIMPPPLSDADRYKILFLFNDLQLIVKALSLLCIGTHLWAADREYGKFISSRLRRNG